MSKIARAGLCLAAWLAGAGAAHAHIKLLKPASWIEEGDLGDPQKSSPCGPPSGSGDETGDVTTYTEGEEITVEWTETVPHNGHFRIALARDRSELIDPKVNGSCQSAEIQDPPELPVLADGLFPTTSDDGQRMFSTKVKLPEGMTCDNCTLQLIQFMTPHGAPCFYYHCANVKIVAAGSAGAGAGGSDTAGKPAPAGGRGGSVAANGGSGGRGGAGGAGSGAASGGRSGSGARAGTNGSAGNPASKPDSPAGASASSGSGGTGSGAPAASGSDSGGCSVATRPTEPNSTLAVLFSLALAFSLRRRCSTPP